ncbi:MAG: response regulator transcription factor [Propionibacteriaceae bacterium]|jgi:DNA-binding NarL/FixJ family response regulator|nr:response regulator transcription factor [Propionibacteriaceae bacterium]
MRLIVAEDSVLLREGLVRLVQEMGHVVVAAVGTAPDLVAAVAAEVPDAVVTDVRMPPELTDDGLRAAVAIRRAHPGLPVLVLSQYVEQSYARDLLADGGGGVGYLLKDRVTDLAGFADSLDRIAAGGSVLDPAVVAQLLVVHDRSPLDRLSAREREVLALIAEGLSNQAIGERLVITDGAVEKHISNIFTKLDLPPDAAAHRRVQAVLAWLQG